MTQPTNRIPAELPRGLRLGTIPAFPPPDGLTPDGISANLNGLDVGLRWRYGSIAAVIFMDPSQAQLWPGFEPD